MTEKELKKVIVIKRVIDKLITPSEAAEVLNLSERQVYRLKAKFKEQGEEGLIHGNRGRKPKHALSESTKERVKELSIHKYPGANDCHLTDILSDRERIHVSVSTVRRIRREAGIPSPKKRRSPKAHRPRKRKQQEGILLQVDASTHKWLKERGPKITLHGAIDDATGKVVGAVFRTAETTEGYLAMLRQVLLNYGVPGQIYSDRHTIFFSPKTEKLSIEDELNGAAVSLSQFGKVIAKLGIGHVKARSPQAKGRIERLWETFQDRLIKEMTWDGISTLDDAQRFLDSFVQRYNAKFAVEPELSESAFQPLPPGLDLDYLLCQRVERKVLSGNCVAYNNSYWQPLAGEQEAYLPKGATVEVLIPYTGPLKLVHNNTLYELALLPARPKKDKPPTPSTPKPHPKPSANHPWRRPFPGTVARNQTRTATSSMS